VSYMQVIDMSWYMSSMFYFDTSYIWSYLAEHFKNVYVKWFITVRY